MQFSFAVFALVVYESDNCIYPYGHVVNWYNMHAVIYTFTHYSSDTVIVQCVTRGATAVQ